MGAQEERSVFDRSVNNSWPPITGGGEGREDGLRGTRWVRVVVSVRGVSVLSLTSEVIPRREVQKCQSVAQFL